MIPDLCDGGSRNVATNQGRRGAVQGISPSFLQPLRRLGGCGAGDVISENDEGRRGRGCP